MCSSRSKFLFCRCTRASKSGFIPWDMIWLHYTTFCFFPSSLSFGPFHPLTIFFLSVLLITLFLALRLLFCAMKFSFHTLCHLGMAYELCISTCLSTPLSLCLALSQHPLVTRFPSLLPPPSVNQRKSDKIRPLTLWFVFTHITLVFFPPSLSAQLGLCRVEFYGSLCNVSGARLVSRVWRRSDKSPLTFKHCFIVNTVQA